MVVDYKSIIGKKILEFDSGEVVGLIKDIIVHPDTGKVEGFWVKSLSRPFENFILPTDGILEWKHHVYVRDEDEFSPPEDLLKLADVLSRNTYYIGNRVVTQQGVDLGKAVSLTLDTVTFSLKTIEAQKGFLIFGFAPRIIPAKQIIEVLPDYILVNDMADKKEVADIKAGQPALDA